MHRGRHRHHRRHHGPGAPWWEALAGIADIGRGFEDWGDFEWNRGSGPGGRGGRRSRKRMFGSGELRLVLLKMISDEPRHGYELMKSLEEMTGGSYSPSPGIIYPTLSLLSDEGAIEEKAGKAAKKGEKAKQKAFSATKEGDAELEDRAEEVEALMGRIEKMGERRERGQSPQLGRAVVNLGTVLANKFKDGKLDSETMEEVVDIIDEAAKRIERI